MHSLSSSIDYKQNCLFHMCANGIPFDGTLKCDGELHRFSMDAKVNQPDEWYACHEGISLKGNPYEEDITKLFEKQQRKDRESRIKQARIAWEQAKDTIRHL